MASRSWKKRVKRGPGGSGWILEQPWALAVTKDGFAGIETGFPESWRGFPQQILNKVTRNWNTNLVIYIEKYICNNNPYHSFPRTVS